MPIQKILLVDDSKTELHHLSELLGKPRLLIGCVAGVDCDSNKDKYYD